MMIGIVLVACLAARVGLSPAVTMQSTLRRTSSVASSGSRSDVPFCRSVLNDDVFTFDVTKLAQSLVEGIEPG